MPLDYTDVRALPALAGRNAGTLADCIDAPAVLQAHITQTSWESFTPCMAEGPVLELLILLPYEWTVWVSTQENFTAAWILVDLVVIGGEDCVARSGSRRSRG